MAQGDNEIWLYANEVADPNGIHPSVMSRALRAKQWRGANLIVREVPGRGRGGVKLQVLESSLPPELRRRSADDQKAVDTAESDQMRRKEEGLAKYAALSERKQRIAKARFHILSMSADHTRATGLNQSLGEEDFVREYAMRRTDEPVWVRETLPQFDVRTLRRWKERERKFGIAGLADNYGNRFGQHKIESLPHVRNAIIGLIAERPFANARHAYGYVCALFPDEDISPRTVRRFVAAFKEKHHQLLTFHTNPDAFKNEHELRLGDQSKRAFAPNDEWVLDDTVSDVECLYGRPYVMGLIDVYTRRLAYLVTDRPSSEALGLLLRRCLLAWGVPKVIRTDNGKIYTSNFITELLKQLGVRCVRCDPFASAQKAHIERSFLTLQRQGLGPLLPGYVGSNVAERQQIRNRLSFAKRLGNQDAAIEKALTKDELQERINAWCENEYEHKTHRGLPTNPQTGDHHSPFSLYAERRAEVRTIENPRALDVLLLKPVVGSVQPKGIRIDKGNYFCDELIPYIGEEVMIRRDPSCLGTIIVFDKSTGAFIGEAHCFSRVGCSREEAKAAKKKQKRYLRDQAARILAPGIDLVRNADPQRAIAQAARERVAGLVAFPPKSVPLDTPGLNEAGKAAAVLEKKASRLSGRAQRNTASKAPQAPEVEKLGEIAVRVRLRNYLERPATTFEMRRIKEQFPDGVPEDRLNEIAAELRQAENANLAAGAGE